MSEKAKYPSWEPEYRKQWASSYRSKNGESIAAKKREQYANDPEYRAKIRARAAAYYQRNKARIKAAVKEYQQANPEKKNESKRRRYREAHGHYIARSRAYSAKRKITGKAATYREKTRARQRAWSRTRSKEVTEGYAREQLSKYSPISAKDWPQELVEAKRLSLQLKHQLKSA